MTARILYIDLFSGVSGDMLLGALLDAGLDLADLQGELSKLDLVGYQLQADRHESHGLTGIRLQVLDTLEAYPARHLADIKQIIQGSSLSERVKNDSLAVFERLARVEAGIHGIAVDQVHFHEIGAVDTIVDVVGFAIGLELLDIKGVYASAIALGSGTIEIAHGRYPVPVPATLALLAEVRAPTISHRAETEIVTPTGAALLAHFAVFERPAMNVLRVGYGFGSKEFPWSNAVRVWVGQAEPMHLPDHDQVTVLECNLDDVTGETLGYTMERLFEAGALDVWFTPIQMKKNRPGVLLSALSPPGIVESLSLLIMRETSTLGVRMYPPAHRLKAERREREVKTPWGRVRVKEKWIGGRCLAVSPEYEDCARLARESGEPLQRVMEAARNSETTKR
ncbi:nickel pincer cofactor biosynthesis protein LarC [Chloroflexota bacterium]